MKTNFWPILILFILSFSACNSQVGSGTADYIGPVVPGWKEFVSDDGSFSVEFPGEPEQSIRTSALGNREAKYPIIEFKQPGLHLDVFYSDIPDLRPLKLDETKSYYDYLRDQTIRMNGSQLVTARDVSIGQRPGHEFIEGRSGTIVTHRLLLVGTRLYALKAEHKDSTQKGFQSAVERFLDSFQIIAK